MFIKEYWAELFQAPLGDAVDKTARNHASLHICRVLVHQGVLGRAVSGGAGRHSGHDRARLLRAACDHAALAAAPYQGEPKNFIQTGQIRSDSQPISNSTPAWVTLQAARHHAARTAAPQQGEPYLNINLFRPWLRSIANRRGAAAVEWQNAYCTTAARSTPSRGPRCYATARRTRFKH